MRRVIIRAINFYKTFEFITYFKEKNAIKSGNKYYDENYMVHFVRKKTKNSENNKWY